MGSWLSTCCKESHSELTVLDESVHDPLLWSKCSVLHSLGEFSVAAVQANNYVEDQVQVETSRHGTFVGVYDGHGGDTCSRYVAQHLFPLFLKHAKENPNGTVGDAIRDAFLATDHEYLQLVGTRRETNPLSAVTGSCCLVGIIWSGTVYVANAGDSRAVLGRLGGSNQIVAQPLSEDHNASNESERHALVSSHSDDPNIVLFKNGTWRVKGIIQTTRSIGDGYLKRPEFVIPPEHIHYQLPEPLTRPAVTAEPSIQEHVIQPEDRFLIFASDGLWANLSNQQAAEIVFQNPRAGIAKRLIRSALEVVQHRCGLRYDLIVCVNKGERRLCHDDITVVVVYIDHDTVGRGPNASMASVSIRGFTDAETPSEFSYLDEVER